MKAYFESKNGLQKQDTTESVMHRIADRYMRENPAHPFMYRSFSEDGFKRDAEARCILDFNAKFPDAKMGEYAYAVSKMVCREKGTVFLFVDIKCPAEIFVNGTVAARTYYLEDECMNAGRIIEVSVRKGDNVVFVKCRKNVLGFGCTIGSAYPRETAVNFYTVFEENTGELGWNYCGPYKEDLFETVPDRKGGMGKMWLPELQSNAFQDTYFGHETLYAVSQLECVDDTVNIRLTGEAEVEVYVDGTKINGHEGVFSMEKAAGRHDIVLKFMHLKKAPDAKIQFSGAFVRLPDCVKGVRGEWLYLDTQDDRAVQGFRPFALYDAYEDGEKEFYRSGSRSYIRAVLEEKLFGKLSYPLGVVLYGFLMTGRFLKDDGILEYAKTHLRMVYAGYPYTLWDNRKFGFACINHLVTAIRALDDCGSFTSAVLESYFNGNKEEEVKAFADFAGDYVLNRQERLSNGMFYRKDPRPAYLDTIWADDLYMSTPFMIRYAKLKGDDRILDDAVNQFLCFKERLFMDDKRLMSHVYNLYYKLPTGVPWGRGNGWVLFSLSELLQVLPTNHPSYPEIVSFFKQLAEGFLERIDPEGMLHQVLWDWDSYAEASCTAMCAVGFARGVRLGLLPASPYKEAAKRCVEGLKRYCIDRDGNIYGVCRGSGYSYREEYYKYELPWILNDTHGTGIVLMALVETAELQ